MLNRNDWLINIENAAVTVASFWGEQMVRQVLDKYGSGSIETLNPVYYSEVFDELDFMANDARD